MKIFLSAVQSVVSGRCVGVRSKAQADCAIRPGLVSWCHVRRGLHSRAIFSPSLRSPRGRQAMKHYCPMCGEQWNDDVCATCGWFEGKQARYSDGRRSNLRHGVLDRGRIMANVSGSQTKESGQVSGDGGPHGESSGETSTATRLCACVSDDAERCIALRYPEAPDLTDDGAPERCACSCHDFAGYDE